MLFGLKIATCVKQTHLINFPCRLREVYLLGHLLCGRVGCMVEKAKDFTGECSDRSFWDP